LAQDIGNGCLATSETGVSRHRKRRGPIDGQGVSKARLVITAVVVEGRSQAEAARAYAVSKGWVSKLLARYRAEGDAAFEARSRRPKTSPNAIGLPTVELIVRLRKELAVSRATVARHLTAHGLVAPDASKRPRSSYIRFVAEQPNETASTTPAKSPCDIRASSTPSE
jgi:Helix-turn-helix domain